MTSFHGRDTVAGTILALGLEVEIFTGILVMRDHKSLPYYNVAVISFSSGKSSGRPERFGAGNPSRYDFNLYFRAFQNSA